MGRNRMPGTPAEREKARRVAKRAAGVCTWGACGTPSGKWTLCERHRKLNLANLHRTRARLKESRDARRLAADSDEPIGRLTGLDLIPCARCSLRGHVPGDPDRCLFGATVTGLGGEQPWQDPRGGGRL